MAPVHAGFSEPLPPLPFACLDDLDDQLAPGAQPLGEFGPALFGARHEQDHLHVQQRRTAERILLAAIHGLQRVDEIGEVAVPGEKLVHARIDCAT